MKTQAPRGGFTVAELLVFSGIFTAVTLVFVGILVVTTKIYLRESAVIEITGQSNFLLQAIENDVRSAIAVEMNSGEATSTLKVRTASSSLDPTYIQLQGTTAYRKQANGSWIPLTSNKVRVVSLSFAYASSTPSIVLVSFTMAGPTSSLDAYTHTVNTSITRNAGAAQFEDDVLVWPTAKRYGAVPGEWKSINNTVFFNGRNVGIGDRDFSPRSRLHILNGNIYLNYSIEAPSGTVFMSPDGACWRTYYTTSGVQVVSSYTCP